MRILTLILQTSVVSLRHQKLTMKLTFHHNGSSKVHPYTGNYFVEKNLVNFIWHVCTGLRSRRSGMLEITYHSYTSRISGLTSFVNSLSMPLLGSLFLELYTCTSNTVCSL